MSAPFAGAAAARGSFAGARVLIVQPPFVQLNAPYPAPYYLRSFLEARGARVVVADHSIGVFERLFSREGLAAVFSAARPRIEARLASPAAAEGRPAKGARAFRRAAADEGPDEAAVRLNLARYLSQERLWTATVDRLVAFLRGVDREFGHLLAAANGALPAGARTLALIEAADGQPGPDDARRVATAMLSDLADLVAAVLDPGFSLVRYAESIAASVRAFAAVEPAVDGWVLDTFQESLLQAEWDRVEGDFAPTEEAPFVLACTIPFPGCLAGALRAARSAKARFGKRVRTAAGGGYVNTELRSISAARFFDYFDFLCFDRGYGSMEAILELGAAAPLKGIYKTLYRDGAGAIVGNPDAEPEASDGEPGAAPDNPADAAPATGAARRGGAAATRHARTDAEAPAAVFPDYRGVDFGRYILPVDDDNPMHRLWSDGRWLKAYLAHGCYWAACAFCDVRLDYIRGFLPVDVDALFAHLLSQAEATGVRGVHLVDEAAPVGALLRLAELNREAGLPLVFWGNIRFERAFTPDVAAVLSAGGLLGVSAGIEIASERGFKRLGKGIGLSDVVRSCAAFKEAGILVHAYLIFGFWDEDEGEIVDSAETMRQLFAAGLVDSAFWHKFVLTRHSRAMREKERGRHPELKPIEGEAGDFADNDLRFADESRTDRWSAPLDALAAAWMAGEELETPIAEVLPFRAPAPTVEPDLVERILAGYARDRDSDRGALPAQDDRREVRFLGSDPVAEVLNGGRTRLRWSYRLQERSLEVESDRAVTVAAALRKAGRSGGAETGTGFAAILRTALEERGASGGSAFERLWLRLREDGIVLLCSSGCDKERKRASGWTGKASSADAQSLPPTHPS